MKRSAHRSERSSEARARGGGIRQAEAQQIIGPLKTPAPDLLTRETFVNGARIGVPHQPVQISATNDVEASAHENIVKQARLALQFLAHAIRPFLIAQRGGTDQQGRTTAGPWPKGCRDIADIGMRNREAQSQTSQPVKFAERFENHDGQFSTQINRADLRHHVSEGLVDHQPAAARLQQRGNACECSEINNAAIGIVRVDDHNKARAIWHGIDIAEFNNVMTSTAPRQRMFAIGRAENGDGAAPREIRQPLDQRLRAGGRSDANRIRHTVVFTRGNKQSHLISTRWQALPRIIRQGDLPGPGPGIDTGRQVKPGARIAAISNHCLVQFTTMFHGFTMPSSAIKRERLPRIVAGIVGALLLTASHAMAAAQPRIASINVCTDQLLMALADPEQIIGLSPYSRSAVQSWDAANAANFPLLSGEAEDILMLKPDIVVAGSFTKRATRELLKQQGLRVAEFSAVRTIDDVKAQITLMGKLVGHADRSVIQIARIDAAIARTRAVAARKRFRVLALSRRGWVSGGSSLTSSLLDIAGLGNAAGELGLKSGGFATLEAIIALRPDFLLVSSNGTFAEDEGRAFLLHPALERFYPQSRRIVIPERLTVCGGPMLAEALERLSAELERLEP